MKVAASCLLLHNDHEQRIVYLMLWIRFNTFGAFFFPRDCQMAKLLACSECDVNMALNATADNALS